MIFISFILDGIISNYFDYLVPLSIITSISVLSYYMEDNILLKEILIAGILYDVVYTNTIILNALVFYVLYIVTIFYNKKQDKNLINLIILNNILIFFYLAITYLILSFYQVININIKDLLIYLLNCFIFNTIYIIFLYYLFHKKKKYA